jgi:hypothetical protein
MRSNLVEYELLLVCDLLIRDRDSIPLPIYIYGPEVQQCCCKLVIVAIHEEPQFSTAPMTIGSAEHATKTEVQHGFHSASCMYWIAG